MDPSIVRKRDKKKRKAPAPPNPFTGEQDNTGNPEVDSALDDDDFEEEEVDIGCPSLCRMSELKSSITV